MEFADGQCYLCGKAFGNRKPKTVTKVDKPCSVPPTGRLAEFVSPCPFCGQNVPLWGGSQIAPEPESPEPEHAPEPESPEPEPEAGAPEAEG